MGVYQSLRRRGPLLAVIAAVVAIGACVVPDPNATARYRWWSGLGPVLPHDTFPADCQLCHLGSDWNTLRDDFEFDHERETGVPLDGAHDQARCLLCHNDRGPVREFQEKGCIGCHEDFHLGELGPDCQGCHTQETWQPYGQIAMHNRTRFPLTGTHALTACHRCHPGAFVGNFVPTDTECLTCHQNDLANANNPPHIALGWVDNCDRCHIPTSWNQVRPR